MAKKALKSTDRRRGNLSGRSKSTRIESEVGEGKRLTNFHDRRAVQKGKRAF